MPTIDEHITQARHNEAFINTFDPNATPYKDWILIGLFYAGIHYIEAFLATKNTHTQMHSQRDRHVGLHLKRIYSDYRELKHKSEAARYYCKTFTVSDINDSKRRVQSIKSYLKGSLPQIV